MDKTKDNTSFFYGICKYEDVQFFFIADSSSNIIHLCFSKDKHDRALKRLSDLFKTVQLIQKGKVNYHICQQFQAYMNGEQRQIPGKIQTPFYEHGTEFQKRVWQSIYQIKYGKTKTYVEIAEALGNRKLARAVGGACNKNPLALIIPCHRVVGTNDLGGFAGGTSMKRRLLAIERKQQTHP